MKPHKTPEATLSSCKTEKGDREGEVPGCGQASLNQLCEHEQNERERERENITFTEQNIDTIEITRHMAET